MKLLQFVQHHWPDSRLGLDFDIQTVEGQERLTVWSDSFGEPPTPEELGAWDPEKPESTDRPILSHAELREQRANPFKARRNKLRIRLSELEGKPAASQLSTIRSVLEEMLEM